MASVCLIQNSISQKLVNYVYVSEKSSAKMLKLKKVEENWIFEIIMFVPIDGLTLNELFSSKIKIEWKW